MRIEQTESLGDQARTIREAVWREHDTALYGADAMASWDAKDAYRQSWAFTAFEGEEVAGMISGWVCQGVCYFDDMVVVEGFRNQGVATQLLEAAENLAAERDARRLALHADPKYYALDAYTRRGWYTEFEIPDWVGGHAWVQMRKDL